MFVLLYKIMSAQNVLFVAFWKNIFFIYISLIVDRYFTLQKCHFLHCCMQFLGHLYTYFVLFYLCPL